MRRPENNRFFLFCFFACWLDVVTQIILLENRSLVNTKPENIDIQPRHLHIAGENGRGGGGGGGCRYQANKLIRSLFFSLPVKIIEAGVLEKTFGL